ncbi:phosphotransferase family protein [Caldibacillus kokeshiiformis]|jgi:thiamine kinase-like enzyme|nr:phosphotransferase family protein [Pallidibacillus thermolactis subsp. kokeshiiformis]
MIDALMRVKTVDYMFEKGWVIKPAGGVTGEAFLALHNNEKLFIKRNSSPFLAVLSAEGIVPKLVWTKRLENGDVITAQQWIKGRKLEPEDMNCDRVAKLLNKIHRSKPLLSMMRRLGKTPVFPETLLMHLEKNVDDALKNNPTFQKAHHYLKTNISRMKPIDWAVCHGDMNHNNWMLTDQDELYLIDWESAIIGDPAFDIGPLLYWYVPENEWNNWLEMYGLSLTDEVRIRLKWYAYYQTLLSIQFFKNIGRNEDSIYWLEYLEKIK